MRRGKGSRRRFRGVALAEAAIVMMLLCMVTLGAIKYGWLFYRLHTVNLAAREGARTASLLGSDNGDVTAAIAARMEGAGISHYDLPVIDPSADSAGGGTPITVTVSVSTGEPGVDLIPGFLPTPPTLVGRTTMAKEGAG